MKATRYILLAGLAAVLLAFAAAAQEKSGQTAPPGPTVVSQAKFPITLQGADYELLSIIMDFPPGTGVSKHSHGGHVLVTMLSGEMTLKEGGAERILKTGESWTENPGAQHSVVNAGSVPARVAVSMLLPKGAEATTIVK